MSEGCCEVHNLAQWILPIIENFKFNVDGAARGKIGSAEGPRDLLLTIRESAWWFSMVQ